MKRLYYITTVILLFITLQAAATPDSVALSKQIDIDYKTDISTSIDTIAKDSVKKGFFRSIYRYFENANVDKTLIKKFDFSIIGGPHYSSDIKLGLGLVAAGLFRIDRTDLSIPPSNVSFFGDVTTTGFFLLGVRGNVLFKSANSRIDFTSYFFSMPSAFWGIGYDDATNNTPSSYKRLQGQIRADFLFRIYKKLYIGPNFSVNYIEGENFTNTAYLYGQNSRYFNASLGLTMLYDTRDIMTNAYRGIYLRFIQSGYPGFLGNKGVFGTSELTFDAYHPVWKGAVLAYDFHTELNYGDVPWTMLSKMGGSYRMRGYYEGRYRDKNIMEFQVELRQRIWRRIGATVWGGVGNVFPSFNDFSIKKTLPNYGLGVRWEFKNRVNVRLDYGFGAKGQNGFLFSINEAF